MLHIMPIKNFYLSKKNPHDIHLEFNLIYESYTLHTYSFC